MEIARRRNQTQPGLRGKGSLLQADIIVLSLFDNEPTIVEILFNPFFSFAKKVTEVSKAH